MKALSEKRAYEVAHTINAHLPETYRQRLAIEELRIQDYLRRREMSRRLILIIGGAGYIGSVLIGHLLERGYRVRCADLLLYENHICIKAYLSNPDFEFVPSDHVDTEALAAVFEGVTDAILLAGLVGDPITKKYPEESAVINHEGYFRLADQLDGLGLNKVVFVSTCSNYGLMSEDVLADEESNLNPLSAYAWAKVAVEEKFMSFGETKDFAPIILRFATAFGLSPRMRFDLTISQFTRDIALGSELVVYDADTWRPYCHVQDFSEVIRRVLEAPVETVSDQIFNAGGDENNFTKRMIIDTILRETPQGRVRYQDNGSDPRNYRVSFKKIRNTLHFEPARSVIDGIRELLLALGEGRFTDIENPSSFYGNYEIFYEIRP